MDSLNFGELFYLHQENKTIYLIHLNHFNHNVSIDFSFDFYEKYTLTNSYFELFLGVTISTSANIEALAIK